MLNASSQLIKKALAQTFFELKLLSASLFWPLAKAKRQ